MKHPAFHALVFGTAALVASVGASQGANAAPDFSGKRIDVIIGSTPGGGTDGTTRLVGRFLEKYLPGKPQMIYRNMPGGHAARANNYFYNSVKPDGLTWLGGGSGYVDPNNLRRKVVKYNPTHYVFIGGINRGGSIVAVNRSKIKNLTDRTMAPVVIGTMDGTRSWATAMAFGARHLGWNIKFVVGYPGTAALHIAARRGEIDGFGTSNIATLKSVFKTGDFVGVVQNGQVEDGRILRRNSFPGVPPMPELMKGKVSGLDKAAFGFWISQTGIDKWYALPPKTPDDIAGVYRAAFAKATKDPEFIRVAKHQFSADFRPVKAATIAAEVKATAYPDTAVVERIRQTRIKVGLPGLRLSDAELARLAEKLGGRILKVEAKLDGVKRGGRVLHFKNGNEAHTARVSSSRSKVVIDGKKAKRGALKPGMTCQVSYAGNGGEVKTVTCGGS